MNRTQLRLAIRRTLAVLRARAICVQSRPLALLVLRRLRAKLKEVPR